MKNYDFVKQTNGYLDEKELKELRLTDSEINSIGCFKDMTSIERECLSDFVYSISKVLFKSFNDESAGLFQKILSKKRS